jgi:hypothetical protein
MAGMAGGLDLLRRTGADGVLVDDAGLVHRSAGLFRFTFTGSRRGATAGGERALAGQGVG